MLFAKSRLKVAVVGAGIIGAASAFYLSQQGIEVHLFDLAPGSAEGVTYNAFGWVNKINGDPSFVEAYKLRISAVDEYESVFADIPELSPRVRRGSLVWKDSAAATAHVAAQHKPFEDLELLTGGSIPTKEPGLKRLPHTAIYSPRDIAISPTFLARSFLARAERSGAVLHYGLRVDRLKLSGKTVEGVQTESGLLRFDLVLLAAGTQTASLLESIGISLCMDSSPAVLLRYRTRERFISNVLSFPELEIRQAEDRTVLIVEDFHAGCEDRDFDALRLRVKDVLHDWLSVPDDLEFSYGAVGHRPVFSDGLPRSGFAQYVEGLYFLVGHPGIILAPLLSRLAARQIVSRQS